MRKNLHLTPIRVLLIYVIAAIVLITEGGITQVRAGDDPDELLNYSFAIWVGSGFYNVSGANKRIVVLRVPFAYTLRPSQYDKTEFLDKLGFRLLFPAVVALQEETDTNFTFGAGAFVPGLEVQIPVNSYWTLKPFAQFGAGKDTAGGDLDTSTAGAQEALSAYHS